MSDTTIEWTDVTWNPVTGCRKVSPGCQHCYAETIAKRFWKGRKFTDVQTHADRLDQPLRWRKPRMVFVNSMSDLFHEDVPDEFIDQVFAVMALCQQHTFQVLTKRAERMYRYMKPMARAFGDGGPGVAMTPIVRDFEKATGKRFTYPHAHLVTRPLSNVWLGVSCEDQQRADERIPWLLKTPASVRFVSAEPLLGGINFGQCGSSNAEAFNALDGIGGPNLAWVIVGGESGPGARPCNVEWIRSIVEQCQAAGVACFVKQMGSNVQCRTSERSAWMGDGLAKSLHSIGDTTLLTLTAAKGGDPAEWPADLRVRQFPLSASPRLCGSTSKEAP